MTMFYIGFEVKTGKRKGFYIAVHEQDTQLQLLLAKAGWGMLPLEYNLDFYKAHALYRETWKSFYQIWTHSRFGGHELYRKVWTELKEQLGAQITSHYATK